jgi:2-haloalkanoic acid dehalogenase type II
MGFTLITPNFSHPGEVFHRILTSLDLCKSLDDVKTAFQNAENEARALNLFSSFGKMNREAYWLTWDILVLKHLGIEENAELARIVQTQWEQFVDNALYPETREVLTALKTQGLKIGLISNVYEEEINRCMQQAGLEIAAFDVVVGVDTVGEMKPHPDIFKYALRKLNVQPEETLFVGDDLDADYKGAENVGMHALLINRTERKVLRDLTTITDLREILSRID